MTRRTRGVLWLAVAVMGLVGCGHSSSDTAAVRVGDATISDATVDHWASTMAGADPGSGSPGSTPQRRALAFLISSRWLIGEAAAEGMAVSGQEVAAALAHRISSYANGEAEFHQLLELKGETVADVRLDAEVELAAAKIQRALASKAGRLTEAQVAAYYGAHKPQFVEAAKRQVEIVYSETRAGALKLKREVQHGRALSNLPRSESLVYTQGLHYEITPFIFAATPHVLTGPVRVGGNYFVFEVGQVMPERQQTLAEVGESIERQLSGERKQATLSAFLGAWTRSWMPRTDCLAGSLQSACQEYLAAQARSPQAPSGL